MVARMDGIDVIAAIATGNGPAAIGIVRLSGPGTHALVARLCPGLPGAVGDRRLARTRVVDPATGRPLDQALAVRFAAGASYTGEEAAEIHAHGGPAVLSGILAACLAAGARPARPGEFTRRALAAGRLDLAQAEAVALLADAATPEAVDVALEALSGRPSAEVRALESELLDLLADLEADLDFDEGDGVRADADGARIRRDALAARVDAWRLASRAARPALTGVRIVLCGAPNAGKSSLFNALLGSARAIVHADPGTTRDVVGEPLVLAGVPCVLLDTAGLREAPGPVEADGVARALAEARDADCRVLVIDGAAPAVTGCEAAPDVVALAKADRWTRAPDLDLPEGVPVVATSVVDGRGLDELRDLLARRARQAVARGAAARVVAAGERQLAALDAAAHHLAEAAAAQEAGAPGEVAAGALRRAARHVAEVTGARVDEEILDRVFRRFCVGK
jgi:tRNA modification GTPase